MPGAYQDTGFAYQGSGLFAYQVGVLVEPTVILYGGDDAPRKRKRKRIEHDDFFKAITRTIHAQLFPERDTDTQDLAGSIQEREDLSPENLERQYQTLVGLAQDSHRSLQALGVIRQEIDAYIARLDQAELEDEEFLMMS